MRKRIIELGQKFNRLTVVNEVEKRPASSARRFLCHCDCGNKNVVDMHSLRSGKTKSCGCYRKETVASINYRHGGSHTPLHNIYDHMKRRCGEPTNPKYPDYGGRGIRVCPEWLGSYAVFREWALANGYQRHLTIERVDVNKGYSPDNCTFIPMAEQASNKRNTVRLTAFGETKTLAQWSRDPRCAVTQSGLSFRVRRGWDHLDAITLRPDPSNPRLASIKHSPS